MNKTSEISSQSVAISIGLLYSGRIVPLIQSTYKLLSFWQPPSRRSQAQKDHSLSSYIWQPVAGTKH